MTLAPEDARLTRFLAAATDDEAEAALALIFDEVTERILVDTVRRGLSGSSRAAADAEDVVSETRVRLIRRLWTLRREHAASRVEEASGDTAIENFAAYVATTAMRTCYAHLRSRFPARTRFRNQIRYGVSRHPQTMLEQTADGVWTCRSRALRLATAHAAATRSGRAQAFIDNPPAFLSTHRIDRSQPLPHLVAAVLAKLDEAIELDRLVDALAAVLGVVDHLSAVRTTDADQRAADRLADPAPDTARELTDRETLAGLWAEVIDLPLNQRIALLLNLRDPDGGAALHALPETGLVSRRELAALLEIPDQELAAIWNDLPQDDLTIAARLGLTRQQVINLRKSARARLVRRTK